MEYTTLGSTGTTVSRICLGCMSFGSTDWRDWVLEANEARPLIDRALDLGINFFDTSNNYSRGESERILGEALAGNRDEAVIATKGYFQMDPDNPNSGGLSRKAIEQELANSRNRLGADTVDLYQVHRWDYETPVAETVRTIGDAVERGHIRYWGASSMKTHRFAELVHECDRRDVPRPATMQNQYNLVYREEEREMNPFCRTRDIGLVPWSPLAQGFLARPVVEFESTTRGSSDNSGVDKYPYRAGNGDEINERVRELAADRGVTMAQISLAWLLHQDAVDAPIVGTTSVEHLEDAVEAVEIDLSKSDLVYLEEPYEPVEPVEWALPPTLSRR